jgi:large subunit ribosomal protein L29
VKAAEVRGMTPEELVKKKREIAQELFILKMKNSLGQVGNPLQIRHMRRDLARVNTILAERNKVQGK